MLWIVLLIVGIVIYMLYLRSRFYAEKEANKIYESTKKDIEECFKQYNNPKDNFNIELKEHSEKLYQMSILYKHLKERYKFDKKQTVMLAQDWLDFNLAINHRVSELLYGNPQVDIAWSEKAFNKEWDKMWDKRVTSKVTTEEIEKRFKNLDKNSPK